MGRNLSDQEFHALYCPVKNTKSALFLVVFFSVTAFVNWKGLHKAPDHPNLVELLFAIIVVVMLAKWLLNFTCFRERLVFGLVIISMVTGEVEGFVPSLFGPHAQRVRAGHLGLSLLGLLVSLSMLVESSGGRTIKPDANLESRPEVS